MKNILLVACALFCTATFSFALNAEETKPLSEVKKDVQDGKAVLVDVREKKEWDEGHLKDAKLVPLSALKAEQNAAADLPKDKTIYLHCKMGKRAAAAAEILNKLGYHAIPLKEGFEDLSKSFEPAK